MISPTGYEDARKRRDTAIEDIRTHLTQLQPEPCARFAPETCFAPCARTSPRAASCALRAKAPQP